VLCLTFFSVSKKFRTINTAAALFSAVVPKSFFQDGSPQSLHTLLSSGRVSLVRRLPDLLFEGSD
jgi:hypothetical protein